MASQSESPDLKVLSWNIQGLKAKLYNANRKERLLEIIEQYDIVLLQETRIGEMNVNKMDEILNDIQEEYNVEELTDQQHIEQRNQEKKTIYVTVFSSRRRGVAILINKPHTCVRASCKDGDYAWVHAEIGDQKYTLMSVYYHSNETADLMNNMSTLLSVEPAFQNKLVMGGDFNTTLHPTMDAINENKQHRPQRERMQKLINDRGLLDVWREKNNNTNQYTYSIREPKSRLDYIFVLGDDLPYVRRCEIDENIDLSDHFPVTLTLKKHTDDEEIRHAFENLQLSTTNKKGT